MRLRDLTIQIILLTVLTKTRMREAAEIKRANRALARCIAEQHTPDEDRSDE